MLGAVFLRRLVDRYGFVRILFVGYVLSAIGIAAVALNDSGVAVLAATVFVSGFFVVGCQARSIAAQLCFEELTHHGVAFAVRVHAVIAQIGSQLSGRAGEARVVVDQSELLAGGVFTQPCVQRRDHRHRLDLRAPRKACGGCDRAEDHIDPVRLRDVHHRHDVILEVLRRRRAGIAGDIIRTCQDMLDSPQTGCDRRQLSAPPQRDPVEVEVEVQLLFYFLCRV